MERTNEKLVAAFAAALRHRRRAANLSQEELAARADVSARFISFLETKKRQPTLTIIAALSKGLGLSMSEFLQGLDAACSEPARGDSGASDHRDEV